MSQSWNPQKTNVHGGSKQGHTKIYAWYKQRDNEREAIGQYVHLFIYWWKMRNSKSKFLPSMFAIQFVLCYKSNICHQTLLKVVAYRKLADDVYSWSSLRSTKTATENILQIRCLHSANWNSYIIKTTTILQRIMMHIFFNKN